MDDAAASRTTDTPTTPPAARVAAALSMVALGPVAVLASNGTVPVLGLLALAARRTEWRRTASLFRQWPFAALAVFLGWCLASALWADDSFEAFEAAARHGLVSVAVVVALLAVRRMDAPARALLAKAVLVGMGLMLVLFAVEIATGSGVREVLRGAPLETLTKTSRGSVVLAIMIWPAAAILAFWMRRPLAALALWAAGAAIVFSLNMSASKLAVILATLVFAAAWFRPLWVMRAIQVALVALMLASPLVPRYLLNQATLGEEGQIRLAYSWQHRVQIWQFCERRIAQMPLLGHGFDASRTIEGQDNPLYVLRPIGQPLKTGHVFSLHPHNASLQIWMELGGIGALLAAVLCAGLVGLVRRLSPDPRVQAATLAAAASFLVNASVSFGIWQSWFLASGAMGAAGLVLLAGLVRRDARPA